MIFFLFKQISKVEKKKNTDQQKKNSISEMLSDCGCLFGL